MKHEHGASVVGLVGEELGDEGGGDLEWCDSEVHVVLWHCCVWMLRYSRLLASKLYGVNATIIIFVFVLYFIVL